MKKIKSLMLTLALVLSATGCANQNSESNYKNNQSPEIGGEIVVPGNDDVVINDVSPGVGGEPLDLPLVATYSVYSNEYYISKDSELIKKDEIIDTDVCSVKAGYGFVIYLKTDGTLWGMGTNKEGQLGDGTGIDQSEPVKIMEDVADFGFYAGLVYAIKKDRTFWIWGKSYDSTQYEPIQTGENIVKVAGDTIGIRGDGTAADCKLASGPFSSERLDAMPGQAVYDVIFDFGTYDTGSDMYWIGSGKNLWKRQFSIRGGPSYSEANIIAENVEKIYYIKGTVFYITTNGKLYGFGTNFEGQLGDGTKVPRETPVELADDVANVKPYGYIKTNGELWTWEPDAPTPVKQLDNAVTFVDTDAVILEDGKVIRLDLSELLSDVKIPETVIYE